MKFMKWFAICSVMFTYMLLTYWAASVHQIFFVDAATDGTALGAIMAAILFCIEKMFSPEENGLGRIQRGERRALWSNIITTAIICMFISIAGYYFTDVHPALPNFQFCWNMLFIWIIYWIVLIALAIRGATKKIARCFA